ncbi:protein prune homolog, partial [Plakobranchus ocellatus]
MKKKNDTEHERREKGDAEVRKQENGGYTGERRTEFKSKKKKAERKRGDGREEKIKAKPGTAYVPILNIPRKNFRLRLETVYILSKHSIYAQDLIFVSDIDLKTLTPRSGGDSTLTVTLVDHHVLSDNETFLRPYVEQVFDHRPQDGQLPDSWKVTLEHVGSCCSLIARELLASEQFELESDVAELLLGTILTDTGNMSASDHIGTPGDHEQLVKLKAFLPPSISATGIYEEIQRAKFDLSSLTVREMLEKDLKIVKGTHITVAMSSVTKDLEEILQDPDLLQHAHEFCTEQSADVAIIMTIVMGDSGIRRRCIAIYSPNRVYREQITDVIERSTSPDLELQPLASGHENITAFVQNNLRISRKGVLPLVRDFLTGEVTASSSADDFFSSNFSDNAAASFGEGDKGGDKSEKMDEEMRRHINMAKANQSEQFRTSQDRYDLAAVGNNALISPSLSSDSDLGILAAAEHQPLAEFSLSHPDLPIPDYLLSGPSSAHDTPDGKGQQGLLPGHGVDPFHKDSDSHEVPVSQGDLLIDLNGEGDRKPGAEFAPSVINSDNLLVDVGSGDGLDNISSNAETRFAGECSVNGGSVSTPPIVINCHAPFELMCPANIADTMMTDFYSTSLPTSGQGSKVPSYPETPPNSYMGSSFSLNRETQLPSFNSSEMVKRIQQKKAALAGHSGHRRANYDDEDSDGLAISGSISIGSSGGGGSLISPAVPQNSYIDSSSGFDFMAVSGPSSEIPGLSSSDSLMERVNEKRSQFEWSVESSGHLKDEEDINEAVGASGAVGGRMESTDSGGGSLDPPVPYTPQNSYVEGGFDLYSRTNLPSLNSAEMVARIRAKQSAMFGSSGSSSRVSRSSHGSDDSGGCRSPDVIMGSGSSGVDGMRSVSSKASRGASLDSPQQPYTPQNSYRDSMGLLEYRNRLPDLNEVAERLSTEREAENSKRGKSRNNNRSESSDDHKDDGEDEDVDRKAAAPRNDNFVPGHGADALNNLQPLVMSGTALLSSSPHHQQQQTGSPRKSSSRSHSDSQNTMSDVDSLMSVSTDVGTPLSENVVATGLASQMLRGEMALIGRKDTTDSDVFVPPRGGDDEDDQKDKVPKQNHYETDLKLSNHEKRKHLKFSLNEEGKPVVIPNGPVAEEDLIHLADGEQATGFGTFGISKNNLFSPIEPSRDDQGFVNIAESIVAESIAAALQISSSLPNSGSRAGSRLRWTDQISSEALVSPENVVAANLSASILHEGSDRWQSHASQDVPKTEDNVVSQNIVTDMMGNLTKGGQEDLNKNRNSNKDKTNSSHHQREGEGDPDNEDSQAPADASDQSISDVALNELAFEIAHELIQNVLENFPAISSQAEAQDMGRSDGQSPGPLGATEGPSRRVGVVDNMLAESSAEISAPEDPHEDPSTLLSSPELRKFSTDSNSSGSTSCSDRKWSRDTDSALTIIEDEVVASFPGRQEQDLEEEIKSFPGRKFSKSEDYPSRRFSREEQASRRASKIGEQGSNQPDDQFEDIKVAPDGLETDYLPNMDPLQGNLDIIDASFSRITDADREVVEGESFRKVSGQELGISTGFQHDGNEDDKIPEEDIEGDMYGKKETSIERGIMKKEEWEESALSEGSGQVAVKAPRTKKKIRVSFSEDVEDELGDSNSSCSAQGSSHSPSRSVLRSPPPFAQPIDPDTSERKDIEDEGLDVDAYDDDDDDVLLSPSADRPESSAPSKEVYHTTAGRISIPSGGDSDRGGSVGSVSSPQPGVGSDQQSFTASKMTRDQHQVGNRQWSASDPDVSVVSPDPSFRYNHHSSSPPSAKADQTESLPATKPTNTTSKSNTVISPEQETISDPLTFFQTPESYNAHVFVSSQISRNSIPHIHNPEVDSSLHSAPVTCDPSSVNPDPSCVDPSVMSDTLMYCQTQPACDASPHLSAVASNTNDGIGSSDAMSSKAWDLNTKVIPCEADTSTRKKAKSMRLSQVSGPQPAISDPLTSKSFGHSRNLSSASFGSVKGAVYTEEWQDDDIAGIAAQSGIDISSDDHRRRKIMPDPGFARQIADGDDDDDDEAEEDEDDEEDEGIDDNNSDIGDLEWERRRLLQERDDTPIQPQQRPSIQPTLSQDGAHGGAGADSADGDELFRTSQRWKRVSVSGFDFNIDMQAVEPYRSVLSHGGYYAEGLNAIIVFYGCNLPSRRREDYSYIMNHLF